MNLQNGEEKFTIVIKPTVKHVIPHRGLLIAITSDDRRQ